MTLPKKHPVFSATHLALFVGVALLFVGGPRHSATACSCLGPITLFKGLQDDRLAAVKIAISSEFFPSGEPWDDDLGNFFRYYRATIIKPYKGCNLRRGQTILVTTGGNSALCGFDITPRTTYLMIGRIQSEDVAGTTRQVLSVDSCTFQSSFFELTRKQRSDLLRRPYRNICPPELCPNVDDCGPVPPIAPPQICPDGSETFYDISCIKATTGTTYSNTSPPPTCQWDIKSSSCPACMGDEDCSFTSYCSAGLCTTKGTCDSVDDCFHPSNVPLDTAEPQCILDRTCNAGRCESKCCQDVVECFADPCEVLDVSYHTCVSDYCGGCDAYAFDKKGNLVSA
jgi:hypothetical protein